MCVLFQPTLARIYQPTMCDLQREKAIFTLKAQMAAATHCRCVLQNVCLAISRRPRLNSGESTLVAVDSLCSPDATNPTETSPLPGSYPRAKLSNIYLARELNRRRMCRRASAVHPGVVHTNIIPWFGPESSYLSTLIGRWVE